MDYTTTIGLLAGVGALLISVVLEGGHLSSLISLPAFVLVFGGTLGATAIGYHVDELKKLPALLSIAFRGSAHSAAEIMDLLTSFAEKARREGILGLEENLTIIEDPFLKKGMQLVIDGTDADLLRSVLETELTFMQERHHRNASIFETAGGFAPTMGIIGTVMGLVHVLGNLKDSDTLGPAIATAFIATLYGVASANLFFLPVAAKLKNQSSREIFIREITMEGILALQAGDNPRIIAEKLKAFLAPEKRRMEKKDEGPNREGERERGQW